jgi:photosystem II PsbY protein
MLGDGVGVDGPCRPCTALSHSSPQTAAPAPKSSKKRRGVATAVGLGAAASMLLAQNAEAATEVAQLAASDNRVGAIATLLVPALGWVGFNMLQPALNQLDRMSDKVGQPAAKPSKRR